MHRGKALLYVLAGLIGVGATVGLRAALDDGGPVAPRTDVIAQASSASSSGLKLTLTGATFSALDTTVLLAVERSDGTAVRDLRFPPGSLKSSGLGGTDITAIGATADGKVVVRLPPVVRPGRIDFTIEEIATPGGEASPISGPWALTLTGPAADRFAQAMQLEQLQSDAVDVAQSRITFSASRTSIRTILEYVVPSGLVELSPPRVALPDGSTSLPLFVAPRGVGVRAEYPATPFGTKLIVEMGAFATNIARSDMVTIAFESFSTRADVRPIAANAAFGTKNTAAVDGEDILQGENRLLLEAGYGFYLYGGERRDTISLVFAGNWDLRQDASTGRTISPTVIDAAGNAVTVVGVNSAFSKNAEGVIAAGRTTVELEYSDKTALQSLTVLLDGPAQVVSGPRAIILTPA
ncbi:MAG: hypothetical protein HYX53_01615 [Chloroflexi bacterium]|nr:hypothetical protein [Chloroflexota bacterium]